MKWLDRLSNGSRRDLVAIKLFQLSTGSRALTGIRRKEYVGPASAISVGRLSAESVKVCMQMRGHARPHHDANALVGRQEAFAVPDSGPSRTGRCARGR